jgi:two-component system, OmpR family, response regulator PrrA
MALVLVVEDDVGSRMALIRELSQAGHAVRSSGRAEALASIASGPPDVILVELDVSDRDSVGYLGEVRSRCAATVLVFSDLNDEDGITRLLYASADGVLVRPFSGAQLVARVAALLRRMPRASIRHGLEVGGLRLDPARRHAQLDGRTLQLTPREFELLVHLARRQGEVVSRRELLAEVWNQAYLDPQTVDVHLSCLRRKLGETASMPAYLQTVRGVGIRLDAPVEASAS